MMNYDCMSEIGQPFLIRKNEESQQYEIAIDPEGPWIVTRDSDLIGQHKTARGLMQAEALKRIDAMIEKDKDDPLCWMKPIAWKGLRFF